MEALARYEPVRPAGSAPRRRGSTSVTATWPPTSTARPGSPRAPRHRGRRRDRAGVGVGVRLLPMTDDRLATMIELATGEEVSFQDYFVRLRHDVPVRAVRFEGRTVPPAGVPRRPRRAPTPSSSPRRTRSCRSVRCALPGVDELLTGRRDRVVAVSPIVGGAALKGPADRMLTELGHEPSVVGVARLYAPIAAALVIDPVDVHPLCRHRPSARHRSPAPRVDAR